MVPSRGVTRHFDLMVSQGPTVASPKTSPSLLVAHVDATGPRGQGPWGSAPRKISTQACQRAVRTPTQWLLLGGPPSIPHGPFLYETASSRTFPWLCASTPTLGAAFLFLFHSGSSGHVLAARWRPLGRASVADGLVDRPPFAQEICTGQAAPVAPAAKSTLHGHMRAGSDRRELGQGTAVQLRWRDRSCPGGARGAPLVLDVSPHSVGAALGVLTPVPSHIQPGAGSQSEREHPETQKCKMMGK